MNPEELKKLEKSLWDSADTMRANSDLKSTEYSTPVLGLIFLKFADNKYSQFESEIKKEYQALKGTRREKPIHEIAVEKCGFYLPDHARYDYLLNLPEQEELDRKLKQAMAAIEEYKTELKGVLPQDEYFRLTRTDKTIPKRLLKNFSNIPKHASGDLFGQIYEYFLGKFAMAEGQKGGEFFTPRSVVRVMVEIIEPHGGKLFDPACGSGGMFVQSAQFIRRRKKKIAPNDANDASDFFAYGQEKTLETVKLAKMNLAVNATRGDIRQANTYNEDVFNSLDTFDYVLANPPFNVDDVNLKKIENQTRFNRYGLPRRKTKGKKKDKDTETVPNANYLWINLFATSLKPGGRAGLVMANSASDARHSEADIRKTLVENNLIYAMLTLPSNMFYTVTLPATLWFFDKAKRDNRILFIDARNIFTQVDRAHREFSGEQVLNIAVINRLHRGERERFTELVESYFEQGMKKLALNKDRLKEVSVTLAGYLESENGDGMPDLSARMEEITELEKGYRGYLSNRGSGNTDEINQRQRALAGTFAPFFTSVHQMLKVIDRKVRHFEKEHGNSKEGKAVKAQLDELHKEIKEAEYFFTHTRWLQDRFPEARYEDVTGLCKLATLEEVREQDYSLNPGRYVGVVIEEDGKTEEEFIEEILALNDELNKLNIEAGKLEAVIDINIRKLVGEE
jgi:type I restriction enzyme M protein